MFFWLITLGGGVRGEYVAVVQGDRYPVEVISPCVWPYFRFALSFREVEELMLRRGVVVSYGTVRRWCAEFGQAYANGLRRRRPRPGGKWHLDELFIKVNGELKYLWRAVDQDGNVLPGWACLSRFGAVRTSAGVYGRRTRSWAHAGGVG
jgi:putative transposase